MTYQEFLGPFALVSPLVCPQEKFMHGGHGRGVFFLLQRCMIKHHTILQRIPSPNKPDSRTLGLVCKCENA